MIITNTTRVSLDECCECKTSGFVVFDIRPRRAANRLNKITHVRRIKMSVDSINLNGNNKKYFSLFVNTVQLSLETEKTWLQCQCDRWGLSKCIFVTFFERISFVFVTHQLNRIRITSYDRSRGISIDAGSLNHYQFNCVQQFSVAGHDSRAQLARIVRSFIRVAGRTEFVHRFE